MILILPIGHERTQVRRLPLVCVVILALNVLAFLATYVREGPTEEREVHGPVVRALEYHEAHPYLELSPALLDQLLSSADREEHRGMIQWQRAEHGPAPPAARVAEEQAELDQLCQRAAAALSSSFGRRFGFIPARARPHTIVSSMFLHGGWLHLIGNMLFFYLAGPFLEDVYGRPLFAALYGLGGVAATLLHAAKFPDSPVPLVGASGAIAALMGAFLVRFFAVRIRFFYIFVALYIFIFLRVIGVGRRLAGTFWAPAYVMLPLWLLQQVLYGSLLGDQGGVAFYAHIGGFAFGAFAAIVIAQAKVEQRWVTPGIERKLGVVRPRGLEAAVAARAAGNLRRAVWHLNTALAQAPDDLEANLAMFLAAADLGDERVANRHGARYIVLALRAGQSAAALATYRDAVARFGDLALPAQAFAGLARAADREEDDDLTLDLLARAVDQHPLDPAASRAQAQAASIHERRGEWTEAASLLRQALARPTLDAELKRLLEARLAGAAAAAGEPVSLPEAQGRGEDAEPRRAPPVIAAPARVRAPEGATTPAPGVRTPPVVAAPPRRPPPAAE